MGRDSSFYLLHFESLDDLNRVCEEGPWSVDGALFILEKWRPNLVINKLEVNFISVWVQFHGLPLEYQYPKLAERMGKQMGIFERLDWEDNMPSLHPLHASSSSYRSMATCGVRFHTKVG